MSKEKIQLLSPLFLKYQADYEKNPRSRVFAPLAEMYRKVGMIDKAMEVLSQGIRFHPTYTMGFLGLAFCYYDLRQYNLAYSTLKPLVESNIDNIRLQKLFVNICVEMDYVEEALQTCKYLLFINPRDKEIAQKLSLLEKKLDDRYQTTHQPIFIPSEALESPAASEPFSTNKLEIKPNASQTDFDDWKAVSFVKPNEKIEVSEDTKYDEWAVKKITDDVLTDESILAKEVEVSEEVEAEESIVLMELSDLEEVVEEEEREFHFEIKSSDMINLDQREEKKAEVPLVTHTLVDLYCGQGHIEKALEILEKILILNPNDQRTIDKINEIKSLMGEIHEDHSYLLEDDHHEEASAQNVEEEHSSTSSRSMDDSEEQGRQSLMDIIDQKLGQGEILVESATHKILEERLNRFLEKIQEKALAYQSRF